MHKVRTYFQHHPYLHWLMSVVVTSMVMAGFGLLVHEKDWTFLIGLSIFVPTFNAVMRTIGHD